MKHFLLVTSRFMASLILLSAIAFISSCTQPESEKKSDGTTSSESTTTADGEPF